MEVLRIAGNSDAKAVAGALVAAIKAKGKAELQAVGAGAVNQAVKSIAVARGYVAPNGLNLVCTPAFAEVVINGEARTAIRFMVFAR